MNEPKINALELLKDWSTWLVGIDTGTLALLTSRTSWKSHCAKVLAAGGSVALFVSLVTASILVGALPVIAERLHGPRSQQDSDTVKVADKATIYQCRFGWLRLQD